MDGKNLEIEKIEIINVTNPSVHSLLVDLFHEDKERYVRLLDIMGKENDKFSLLNHNLNSLDINPDDYIKTKNKELTYEQLIKTINELQQDAAFVNNYDGNRLVEKCLENVYTEDISRRFVESDVDRTKTIRFFNNIYGDVNSGGIFGGAFKQAILLLDDKGLISLLNFCFTKEDFIKENFGFDKKEITIVDALLRTFKNHLTLNKVVTYLKGNGQIQK